MKGKNHSFYEIDRYGTKWWYLLNGQLHRENGPAVEYVNGHKEWWYYGKCHRLDGPAVESADGSKIWYYHEQWIDCDSQEEFERIIKLKILW